MTTNLLSNLYKGPFTSEPIYSDTQFLGFRILDKTGLELCRVPGDPARVLILEALESKVSQEATIMPQLNGNEIPLGTLLTDNPHMPGPFKLYRDDFPADRYCSKYVAYECETTGFRAVYGFHHKTQAWGLTAN